MRRGMERFACVAVGVCLLAVPGVAPTQELEPIVPGDMSMEEAGEAGDGLPRLYSLLVNWRGERILERYYNSGRATRPANIKSASKTVLSSLVGIAIDQGLIPGVETPIATYFPDLLGGDADPRKREITIEDLLTMRSGLESTSGRNYGAWIQNSNWVRFALTRPIVSPPGARRIYSTGNTHLLSAILTKASGTSTWEFARKELAGPLGFTLARWPRDPQGIYFGGNDMEMTSRQMEAFGELYLHRGLDGDRQVVSAAWVDASFLPRTRSRRGDELYGYTWWIRDYAGHQTYYAWGYGGQFIFVVPDLELVVVTTSSPYASRERRGHLRALHDLVEDLVIEPISLAMTGAATVSTGD